MVLDFARSIRVTLEAAGFRVLLTREGNQAPSFDDRSSAINGLSQAIFISLHVSSTGPAGTARTYFFVPVAPESATGTPGAERSAFRPLADQPFQLPAGAQPQSPNALPRSNHGRLIEWDRAQQPYLDASRRLAELTQIQLAQKFTGSAEVPSRAAVRQLRTIAAPAIAIEVSNVAALNAAALRRMAQPMAEAVARAVVDFRTLATRGAIGRNGAQ